MSITPIFIFIVTILLCKQILNVPIFKEMVKTLLCSEIPKVNIPVSKIPQDTLVLNSANGLDHLFRRRGISRFLNRRKKLEEIDGELYCDPFVIDRIFEGKRMNYT